MTPQHQGSISANDADMAFNAALSAHRAGDMQGALDAALQTLRHDRAHPGALFMAGSLQLERGDPAAALAHLEDAARLAPQHAGVLGTLGMTYLKLARWRDAADIFQASLGLGARDAELLGGLGQALQELDQWDAAISAFQEALVLAPADAGIHNNLAVALNRKHDYAAATVTSERAVELAPGNVEILANLVSLYEQQNLLEKARQAAMRGLSHAPHNAKLHLVLARCERRDGAYTAAIERLRPMLDDPGISTVTRRGMHFELGRDYDALQDTARAYAHFLEGNRLAKELWPDMAAHACRYLDELEGMLACYTPEFLRSIANTDPQAAGTAPAFLVSFPRSGTTLMDTILDAHPSVSVLEEELPLNHVLEALRRMPGGLASLPTLSSDQLHELRGIYWREVERLIGDNAHNTLVVDKNPFHSTHAPLIHRLFPDARFIFAMRHPCAVVLSCFMQSFGRNPVLANFLDLEATASTYRRVMDLWLRYRAELPLQIHELRYESLIEDKERETRATLEFLGLGWSDEVNDHAAHAKKRGRIYTPSYHQVIRPIYRDALDRWRAYDAYFGTASEILKPYIQEFGYTL